MKLFTTTTTATTTMTVLLASMVVSMPSTTASALHQTTENTPEADTVFARIAGVAGMKKGNHNIVALHNPSTTKNKKRGIIVNGDSGSHQGTMPLKISLVSREKHGVFEQLDDACMLEVDAALLFAWNDAHPGETSPTLESVAAADGFYKEDEDSEGVFHMAIWGSTRWACDSCWSEDRAEYDDQWEAPRAKTRTGLGSSLTKKNESADSWLKLEEGIFNKLKSSNCDSFKELSEAKITFYPASADRPPNPHYKYAVMQK